MASEAAWEQKTRQWVLELERAVQAAVAAAREEAAAELVQATLAHESETSVLKEELAELGRSAEPEGAVREATEALAAEPVTARYTKTQRSRSPEKSKESKQCLQTAFEAAAT